MWTKKAIETFRGVIMHDQKFKLDKYKIWISIAALLIPLTAGGTATFLSMKLDGMKAEAKEEIRLDVARSYASKERVEALDVSIQQLRSDMKEQFTEVKGLIKEGRDKQ